MEQSFDLNTWSIDREFYIEKVFMEKFGYPVANFGPPHR